MFASALYNVENRCPFFGRSELLDRTSLLDGTYERLGFPPTLKYRVLSSKRGTAYVEVNLIKKGSLISGPFSCAPTCFFYGCWLQFLVVSR